MEKRDKRAKCDKRDKRYAKNPPPQNLIDSYLTAFETWAHSRRETTMGFRESALNALVKSRAKPKTVADITRRYRGVQPLRKWRN